MCKKSLSEEYISSRLQEAYQPGVMAFTDMNVQVKESLKRAAVLMPLTRKSEEWHLVLTRRADIVNSHKGQVSFPGGVFEINETVEQTALRESQEEIGLSVQDVKILGWLNDMITITGYRITPVVGMISWLYKFKIFTKEVVRVFSYSFELVGTT